MRYVTPEEQRIIGHMKQEGILRKVNSEALAPGVFCVCGDKDRRQDLIRLHRRKFEEAHGRPFDPQDVKLHGGPVNLVYSPEDVFPDQTQRETTKRFCLYQLGVGLVAKDLSHVDLVFHWPCGQLLLWDLNLMQGLELFALAGEVVRQNLPEMVRAVAARADKSPPKEISVAKHCHFDFGGQSMMETWNFSGHLWRDGREQLAKLSVAA